MPFKKRAKHLPHSPVTHHDGMPLAWARQSAEIGIATPGFLKKADAPSSSAKRGDEGHRQRRHRKRKARYIRAQKPKLRRQANPDKGKLTRWA